MAQRQDHLKATQNKGGSFGTTGLHGSSATSTGTNGTVQAKMVKLGEDPDEVKVETSSPPTTTTTTSVVRIRYQAMQASQEIRFGGKGSRSRAEIQMRLMWHLGMKVMIVMTLRRGAMTIFIIMPNTILIG